jgi:chorismate mutase
MKSKLDSHPTAKASAAVPLPSFWRSAGAQPVALLAGPCSAESPEQLLEVAQAMAAQGVQALRAGVWKPRTRPNQFEGRGAVALDWLQNVRQETGLALITEVASAAHVEAALAAGIDGLWIGARTTVNPFLVQEIAEALRGAQIPVLVKNPVNPDLALWLGGIERLAAVGITDLAACHRGFSSFGETRYRNSPQWEVPLELRRRHPELPLLGDPSHLAGKRELLRPVAQQMLDLGYDGLMIEVHPAPDSALSDPAQQLTPAAFAELVAALEPRQPDCPDAQYHQALEALRAQIDEADAEWLAALARRLAFVAEVGRLKHARGVQAFQLERWQDVHESRSTWADALGLKPEFVQRLLELLHIESLAHHAKASKTVSAASPSN